MQRLSKKIFYKCVQSVCHFVILVHKMCHQIFICSHMLDVYVSVKLFYTDDCIQTWKKPQSLHAKNNLSSSVLLSPAHSKVWKSKMGIVGKGLVLSLIDKSIKGSLSERINISGIPIWGLLITSSKTPRKEWELVKTLLVTWDDTIVVDEMKLVYDANKWLHRIGIYNA